MVQNALRVGMRGDATQLQEDKINTKVRRRNIFIAYVLYIKGNVVSHFWKCSHLNYLSTKTGDRWRKHLAWFCPKVAIPPTTASKPH